MGAWTIVAFDPTFGSFTLLELVSLVKVFRLFRLEPIFAVFRVCTWNRSFRCSECVHSSRYMYNILSIGKASSMFVMFRVWTQ